MLKPSCNLTGGLSILAGITLEQAQDKLTKAMAAYDAALEAQEYSAGMHQRKRMADLEAIERSIDKWNKIVNRLSRGGISIRGATPI